MASDDNPLQPLLNPSTSNDSPHLKYTESLPAITINMTSNPTSLKKKKPSVNIKTLRQRLKKKENNVKDMFMINLSRRLASRKELQTRLSLITDIMCLLALLGIVLMIIENEIKFAQIGNRETPASWTFKFLITLSTIFLVVLVFVYHRLDLNLYAINNVADDWHVGLTYRKIILILFEVIICALHPLVPAFPRDSNTSIDQLNSNFTLTEQQHIHEVPSDVALSLMMFLRLYLLCRFAIYHSRLTHNVGHQSLGYLNQVSINFGFLVKTSLVQWPALCLSICLIIIWFIGSWALRACDRDTTGAHRPMADTMWFFIVTYTTVGYGDMTPSSYCGRAIATIIAFIGLFSSALLIAVVSQKLVLNRWEKYVHDYVLNTELAKKHKTQAANVIKFSIKLWTSNLGKDFVSRTKHFHVKRKLFHSINNIQLIKQNQRELIDNYIGLPEVAILQRNINTTTEDTMKTITNMKSKMDNLEEQFLDMKESIDSIQNTLKFLVDIATKQADRL